jgi:hypothetical protein
MIAAVKMAGVDYKPPSRKALSGPLLINLCRIIAKRLSHIEVSEVIHGVSIETDGCSDVKRRPWLNFLVSSPSGARYLEGINTEGKVRNHEFLNAEYSKIIMKIGAVSIHGWYSRKVH